MRTRSTLECRRPVRPLGGGGRRLAPAEKSPLTRTLDKKEVEEEVGEALSKLGHQATLHCLDGSIKPARWRRMDCDLVFNLAESFAGNDSADACIAAYLRADRQALHRRRVARPRVRAGQGGREKIPRVPRPPHARFRALVSRRLDFRTTSSSP
jgi:hypothetical protein